MTDGLFNRSRRQRMAITFWAINAIIALALLAFALR